MTEPETTPETPSAPSPIAKIKRAFIILIIVLGVISLANLFLAPHALKSFPQPQAITPPTLSQEPPLAEQPTSPPPVAATDHVQNLEERLASLEARLKEQAEIEEDANNKAAGAWKTVAYWQAYDELKAALLSGAPYADALQRFRSLTQENLGLLHALDPLMAAQDEGIATPEQLHVLFKDELTSALKHSAPAENETLGQTLKRNLRGLIIIRKVGAQEGTSVEATLSRAGAQLKANQLTESVNTIETLPIETQEAMHGFITKAKARTEAMDVLHDVRGLLAPPKRGAE